MRIGGIVRVARRRPSGVWEASYHNTQTNWALYSLAEWYLGTSNTSGNTGAILPPTYIALGTGSTTTGPQVSDIAMYAETYGTRQAISYTAIYGGNEAQLTTTYATTAAVGSWSEAGFWDSNVGSATVGSAGATQGSTTLPLGANAPAVAGGSTAGQYNTAYINDGANSEYISLAASASSGATSWSLQSALLHAHAAATPIVVFVGNLWAHVAFSPAVTKSSGEQLSVQWAVPFSIA